MSDARHYDLLETRNPAQREKALIHALAEQVQHAKSVSPQYADLLRDIEAPEISSRAALALLPLTRKADLVARQRALPPFGGLARGEGLARLFISPGPIFEPEGFEPDDFRFARALFATGIRRGDIMLNCFSYHFTPAGRMLESGATALGASVIPAGPGSTEQQVLAIARFGVTAYAGTPEFLKTILEKADEQGSDATSLRIGHVSGGAFTAALRQFYRARGLRVRESYATADLGVIAYESEAGPIADGGGLIVDEGVIVEIVRPGTADLVPDGEVGEVVVTPLRESYPLIRFATGDLSAVLPGLSPCGRTNMRIRGWMGRADQAVKVKGMFVRPEQVAEIARRHPELGRMRL
ncbi:MAG: AMP-binding protein, partial [Acetobacteraceae bacterium]|nr:AMP-binding protein [Acetobacteraceae bacterium]